MVLRIESIHQRNFIHRDIKPENFLIGNGKRQNTIFIIDFGLSKRYKCPKTGQHNELKEKFGVVGTPRYCSLNAHLCWEQSRRDDLESIGNILVYLFRGGHLPWMRAEDIEEEKKSKVEQLSIKENTSIEALTEGLPTCIYTYMKYCRNLDFKAKPDYKYLRSLFESFLHD